MRMLTQTIHTAIEEEGGGSEGWSGTGVCGRGGRGGSGSYFFGKRAEIIARRRAAIFWRRSCVCMYLCVHSMCVAVWLCTKFARESVWWLISHTQIAIPPSAVVLDSSCKGNTKLMWWLMIWWSQKERGRKSHFFFHFLFSSFDDQRKKKHWKHKRKVKETSLSFLCSCVCVCACVCVCGRPMQTTKLGWSSNRAWRRHEAQSNVLRILSHPPILAPARNPLWGTQRCLRRPNLYHNSKTQPVDGVFLWASQHWPKKSTKSSLTLSIQQPLPKTSLPRP